MDENKKSCDECRYFFKHYVLENGRYSLTACGHCINDNFTKSQSAKIIARERKCEFWEPQEIRIAKQRESIDRLLRAMAERIESIADILQKYEK